MGEGSTVVGGSAVIRRAVRSGARVVKDIVELVDLEARGVQAVSSLVRAVPMVPLRVTLREQTHLCSRSPG